MAFSNTNENKNFMTDYPNGDGRWNKQQELNKEMSILPQSPDELENTLKNVNGGLN